MSQYRLLDTPMDHDGRRFEPGDVVTADRELPLELLILMAEAGRAEAWRPELADVIAASDAVDAALAVYDGLLRQMAPALKAIVGAVKAAPHRAADLEGLLTGLHAELSDELEAAALALDAIIHPDEPETPAAADPTPAGAISSTDTLPEQGRSGDGAEGQTSAPEPAAPIPEAAPEAPAPKGGKKGKPAS